ncbi:MAG: NAD(+) synthase [Gemmataceae bacterium]
MVRFGILRVATGVPATHVADCLHNALEAQALVERADDDGAALLVLPELCLTGYTCGDLFHQVPLLEAAEQALEMLLKYTRERSPVVIVGLPFVVEGQLYNCAAILHRGRLLGMVPKSYLPNYKEFYERRWFAPAVTCAASVVECAGQSVPIGTDLLFEATDAADVVLGVEICEDLWIPVPPSCYQALAGATLLVNLSASNDLIAKAAYRRQLILNQSGRCLAAYVYASSGPGESTTDIVFGGHCLIAENGTLLAESSRFETERTYLSADVDVQRLVCDRVRMTSFGDNQHGTPRRPFRRVGFELGTPSARGRLSLAELKRPLSGHPFVPQASEELEQRCYEIFQIQVCGLAKRLAHVGQQRVTIGISGGLDSTLALLVTCKTFDRLGWSRQQVEAWTLPGFGTTPRTLHNARALMQHLGVSANEADIRLLCLQMLRTLGHRPFGIEVERTDLPEFLRLLEALPAERRQDVVFENVQARVRTQFLMNRGFLIGTSDLSELALGWTTYNGDHMSMYNPNVSIPKTLVKFLVRWAAHHEFQGEAQRVLLDIVATEISPELLPPGAGGQLVQSTESAIGPYELHDFFLFYFLRFGFEPAKILYLARQARFDKNYAPEEIRRWLVVFLKRFFANQFKRSCLPDGPKVGSVSLSPRGDWRMPSDAQVAAWIAELETPTTQS